MRATGARALRLCGLALALALAAGTGAGPFAAPALAQAETEAPPSLLLIMDSSGSMRGSDGAGGTKIRAAKEALNGVVDALPARALVGLRVYGHRIPNTDEVRGCRDTELIVPVGPLDRAGMKRRIASFDAKGFTPIGLSLEEAVGDLPSEGRRTIVLVSDGIDTCAPPPPCEVAKDIAGRGIDLRIDTVGFRVDPRARRELQCIARVARGSYVDARSAGELASELRAISVRALRRFEPSGEPVTGSSVVAGAPPLASGQFTDSIAAGEDLYYSVELQAGQSLAASAALVGRVSFLGTFQLELLNPARRFAAQDAAVPTGDKLNAVAIRGGPVGIDAGDPGFAEAGRYYLHLSLEEGSAVQARSFPLELVVDVTGEALPSAGPGEPDDGGAAAPPGGEGNGAPETVMLAVGGVAFGLLGAALGALLARRLVRLL